MSILKYTYLRMLCCLILFVMVNASGTSSPMNLSNLTTTTNPRILSSHFRSLPQGMKFNTSSLFSERLFLFESPTFPLLSAKDTQNFREKCAAICWSNASCLGIYVRKFLATQNATTQMYLGCNGLKHLGSIVPIDPSENSTCFRKINSRTTQPPSTTSSTKASTTKSATRKATVSTILSPKTSSTIHRSTSMSGTSKLTTSQSSTMNSSTLKSTIKSLPTSSSKSIFLNSSTSTRSPSHSTQISLQPSPNTTSAKPQTTARTISPLTTTNTNMPSTKLVTKTVATSSPQPKSTPKTTSWTKASITKYVTSQSISTSLKTTSTQTLRSFAPTTTPANLFTLFSNSTLILAPRSGFLSGSGLLAITNIGGLISDISFIGIQKENSITISAISLGDTSSNQILFYADGSFSMTYLNTSVNYLTAARCNNSNSGFMQFFGSSKSGEELSISPLRVNCSDIFTFNVTLQVSNSNQRRDDPTCSVYCQTLSMLLAPALTKACMYIPHPLIKAAACSVANPIQDFPSEFCEWIACETTCLSSEKICNGKCIKQSECCASYEYKCDGKCQPLSRPCCDPAKFKECVWPWAVRDEALYVCVLKNDCCPGERTCTNGCFLEKTSQECPDGTCVAKDKCCEGPTHRKCSDGTCVNKVNRECCSSDTPCPRTNLCAAPGERCCCDWCWWWGVTTEFNPDHYKGCLDLSCRCIIN
jgi:hypothetical protein